MSGLSMAWKAGLKGVAAGVVGAAGLACGSLAGCRDDDPCAAARPPSGTICTVIGTHTAGLSPDGLPPLATELYLPIDVTIAPAALGAVPYVIDWNNHRIRVLEDGVIRTVIGTGYLGDAQDGDALAISLNHPTHILFEPTGDAIIAAWHNSKVLHYTRATGQVATLAGTGARAFNGDGLAAKDTTFDLPDATAWLPDGRLVISDQANQRLRRLEADGTITTIAGTGDEGYAGDGGPATLAELWLPRSQSAPPAGRIVTDAVGQIFVVDTLNNVVRRIDTQGIITTIAGSGKLGNGASGAAPGGARACDLDTPSDLALGADGSVFIADTMNHCVRKVSPDGAIATVAGQCGTRGYRGDGGPAAAALLDRPYGLDVGPDGALWIADTHNHVVRRVAP